MSDIFKGYEEEYCALSASIDGIVNLFDEIF